MEKSVLVCSLLVHAAKMDENYTEKEKLIILKSLSEIYKKKEDELKEILKEAEKRESEANQILEFTKEIKNSDIEFRKKIIKIIWKIIYSDEKADMYETNLMRRLSSLLYISDRECGEIKSEIIKEKNI
jgi:uncharacterized tellurite resistance protein B-like protein|tara:strand:- start:433 stop:819 length:387 start_codon:yes stop_codon:yes gene_type:complete